MSTVSLPPEQRLLLDGVDWQTYGRLLRALGHRPSVRLTYDRGTLEIMTLSHEHESYAHLLGRFIVALTEELGLPIKGGGSTTFRRRKRRRGLEPDESYWIANESLVCDKVRIDLRTDPPPRSGTRSGHHPQFLRPASDLRCPRRARNLAPGKPGRELPAARQRRPLLAERAKPGISGPAPG